METAKENIPQPTDERKGLNELIIKAQHDAQFLTDNLRQIYKKANSDRNYALLVLASKLIEQVEEVNQILSQLV